MSEATIAPEYTNDHLSNSVIGGKSGIHEVVEFAKTSLIVNSESLCVGDWFGGGTGGNLESLRKKNAFPAFDGYVRFDDSIDPATGDERHDYYVRERYGERRFNGSCTGIIDKYFPHFDARKAYEGMLKRGRIDKPGDEYYRMTEEQVLEQWADTGRDARNHGKAMHKAIEAFLNNAHNPDDPVWEDPNTKPALDRFLRMWRHEIVGKIIPLRTELWMFDRMYEQAGSADFIYTRIEWLSDPAKRSWIGIGDWKRSKKTFEERAYGTGHGHCASLPNESLSKYRLQMSFYGLCVMRHTSYKVVELCLGIFHEKHVDYRWIVVEPLYEIAEKMLVERRQLQMAKYTQRLLQLTEENKLDIEVGPDLSDLRRERTLCNAKELDFVAKALDGLLQNVTKFGATTEDVMDAPKPKRRNTEDSKSQT